MQYLERVIFVTIAAAALMGCKASVNVNAKVSGDVDAQQPDESDSQQDTGQQSLSFRDKSMPPPEPVETDFFGVARQLSLTPGPKKANCSCVAAVVGGANNPAFDWHGDKPNVGPDALVVAISAEGIECEHKGLGPSIAAIEQRGEDVVIVVEEFRDTRPIALGAIIPVPGTNGHVYLRPRGRAPYGRPIEGGRGWCQIGGEPAGPEEPPGTR